MKTKYVDPVNKAKLKAYFTGAIKAGEAVSIAFPEPAADDPAEVYIFNGHIGLKVPACLWAEYMQPVFLRECPKPGESFTISGNVDKTANDWLKFWRDLITPATTPLVTTDYMKEVKSEVVRIFSICGAPLLINEKYLNMFPWKLFTMTGSKSTSPVHAESVGIEVIFLPFRPSEQDERIVACL